MTMVEDEATAEFIAETPRTDPELLAPLGEERLKQLQAVSWREPGLADQAFAQQTARELGIHFATALRLELEDLSGTDYSQHRAYLWPTRDLIAAPEDTVPGMQAAAAAAVERVRAGEKIAIFADYDVDGIMSARVMDLALDEIGATDEQRIWEFASARDGFGLTQRFVSKAHKQGATMLITLDCGSTQTKEIAYAQSLGMTVVVVDHHDVDMANPAEHHLNPRFVHAQRRAELQALLDESAALLEKTTQAKERALANPDDEAAQRAFARLATRAHKRALQLASECDTEIVTLQELIQRGERIAQDGPHLRAQAEELKNSGQEDPAVDAELQRLAAEARQLMADLDRMSAKPSLSTRLDEALGHARSNASNASLRELSVALARAQSYANDLEVQSTNTGAQLSWKFGAALLEQAGGKVNDGWYAQPLYLAGVGALGDMADMRELENRAFCRVPVDEAGGVAPAPVGLQVLAERFGEDPANPAKLIRTRAAINLPKRTSRVEAHKTAALMAAKNRAAARRQAKGLIEAYEQAAAVRDEMQKAFIADWERRCDAIEKETGRRPYWTHGVISGWPEDVGQSGSVAKRMTKPYQAPAVVFTERGPDADGELTYKFSARNDVLKKVKIGKLRSDPELVKACVIAQADEHGNIDHRPSLGGHEDVVSGACRADQIDTVIERFEHFARTIDHRDPRYGWYVRPRNKVWFSKRHVDPADLPQLEEEAKLFAPVTNSHFNFPLRISTAARVRDIGELDKDRKTYPATLELADGSTRPCDIAPEAHDVFATGAWLEVALSLGDERYWLRDCRPLP